jgi:hypothetical protein
MFVKLSNWQLLTLVAVVGAIWAASLFDWSFITGRSTFWQFPHGTIAYSAYDMADVLVGYFYYLQSPWNLPLFYVPALGAPAGANVIFMDLVPIVALIGKLIHGLTGAKINLYGAYLFLCSALPSVMMTLVRLRTILQGYRRLELFRAARLNTCFSGLLRQHLLHCSQSPA